jgi:hypothetical protein
VQFGHAHSRHSCGEDAVVAPGGSRSKEIIIAKSGKPMVPGPLAGLRQKRPLGILAEKLRVPEDFDDPLPDEVIEAFEGR